MQLHSKSLKQSRKRLSEMSICKTSASVSTITVISSSVQDARADILMPFGRVICMLVPLVSVVSLAYWRVDSNERLNLLFISWCEWSHNVFCSVQHFHQSPKRHAVALRHSHNVHFHNEWQLLKCVKCVGTPDFNAFENDWCWCSFPQLKPKTVVEVNSFVSRGHC